MDSIKELWNDTMTIPEARWVIWVTILVILLVVAIFFAKMFRDMAFGGGGEPSARMLSDFEELRDQGKIDDEEFTKLKQTIREQNEESTQPEKSSTAESEGD